MHSTIELASSMRGFQRGRFRTPGCAGSERSSALESLVRAGADGLPLAKSSYAAAC